MTLTNRIADLAQLYQEAGRFDDASALRDYITRHGVPAESSSKENELPGAEEPAAFESLAAVQPTKARIVQSIAIAAYIFSLCLMLLPAWEPRNLLIQPVQPFLGAFGLWQAWNVFSPEIRKENYHLFAIIDYKDGSMAFWEFPRQEFTTGIDQLRAHRFRKWAQDRVKNNTFGLVMPDTARYLARIHNTPTNRPVSVTISMLSANIPEPKSGNQDPLPPHVKKTTLFTYKVTEGDLK